MNLKENKDQRVRVTGLNSHRMHEGSEICSIFFLGLIHSKNFQGVYKKYLDSMNQPESADTSTGELARRDFAPGPVSKVFVKESRGKRHHRHHHPHHDRHHHRQRHHDQKKSSKSKSYIFI